MSRWKGRVLALEALYAWEAAKHPPQELLSFPWVEDEKLRMMSDADLAFPRALIAGAIENIAVIDKKIRSSIKNWDFSRLKRVDLAILRLGAYSLMFQKDIPSSVTIEEAVKLSIEYGVDDSFRFVNGVLDSISKSCAEPATR
ncbi:MAG: transcription antitermination factor NusB [Spirochaetaceae bacterium]|jgi:N utilization substance protein B|nr:transcription antitermination factor NusB [Spirochaetaceae bacterium]